MYKTILVPLDGSKQAEAIFPYAENTALQYGAQIFFLWVMTQPLMLEWDEVVDLSRYHNEFERRTQQAKDYLTACQQEFQKKGIKAHIRIAYGPVVKTILTVAEEIKADLIAMASHGWDNLRWRYNWSVTASVLQRSDPPLLVVRTNGDVP